LIDRFTAEHGQVGLKIRTPPYHAALLRRPHSPAPRSAREHRDINDGEMIRILSFLR
jgi:hypothetical protein